jgi:hypothetical protein
MRCIVAAVITAYRRYVLHVGTDPGGVRPKKGSYPRSRPPPPLPPPPRWPRGLCCLAASSVGHRRKRRGTLGRAPRRTNHHCEHPLPRAVVGEAEVWNVQPDRFVPRAPRGIFSQPLGPGPERVAGAFDGPRCPLELDAISGLPWAFADIVQAAAVSPTPALPAGSNGPAWSKQRRAGSRRQPCPHPGHLRRVPPAADRRRHAAPRERLSLVPVLPPLLERTLDQKTRHTQHSRSRSRRESVLALALDDALQYCQPA